MQKQGFKGQWIAISKKGKFTDSAGTERDLNESFLKDVIANFTPSDAPAVIGHPKDNAPAWGWVSAIRLNNDVLEAQFSDTDDEFEQMVETGKFRKRSASFYLNPPSLRHVGFLGAMPPAVKALRDIQFSDGDSVTVEISFNEEQSKMKDEEVDKVADSVFEKIKNFFKKETVSDAPQNASFTEADLKTLVGEAIADAEKRTTEKLTTEFSEKLSALTSQVNSLNGNSKRSDIISFVESIPAEKGKHFLKRAGIVEFMEALADADAKDEKEAISFSEGEGDAKVEHKFSRIDWFKNYVNAQGAFVEFGEKFGKMVATKDADVVVDGGKLDTLRDGMGIKKTDGGGK